MSLLKQTGLRDRFEAVTRPMGRRAQRKAERSSPLQINLRWAQIPEPLFVLDVQDKIGKPVFRFRRPFLSIGLTPFDLSI